MQKKGSTSCGVEMECAFVRFIFSRDLFWTKQGGGERKLCNEKYEGEGREGLWFSDVCLWVMLRKSTLIASLADFSLMKQEIRDLNRLADFRELPIFPRIDIIKFKRRKGRNIFLKCFVICLKKEGIFLKIFQYECIVINYICKDNYEVQWNERNGVRELLKSIDIKFYNSFKRRKGRNIFENFWILVVYTS